MSYDFLLPWRGKMFTPMWVSYSDVGVFTNILVFTTDQISNALMVKRRNNGERSFTSVAYK